MAFLPETQGTRQSHTVFFQAREERKNTSSPRPGRCHFTGCLFKTPGEPGHKTGTSAPHSTIVLNSYCTGLHKHTA